MSEPYQVALARDMTALLAHLYPTSPYDAIYVGGGSYGTVQSQILYGASYELFPPGRKIIGCILLAGFSPFKYDTGHSKTLNWQNWFSVGPRDPPPSQVLQLEHGLPTLHILERTKCRSTHLNLRWHALEMLL